ncbi:hypothetical protein [Streptacidiphilus sp. PAMC 29251]
MEQFLQVAAFDRSLARTLAGFEWRRRGRNDQKPVPLELLLLDGVTAEARQMVVEEVIREVAPSADSVDIDLISDLPWPLDAQAALAAITDATGAREGETAVVLDLTDERQREWFITLVPHTISSEVWGPSGSGLSFCASDTGSVIGWHLPADRWERVRARLRSRGVDPDSAAH